MAARGNRVGRHHRVNISVRRAGTVGGMATSGSDLDEARRLVVERGLARAAFEHLTVDAFLTLPFEALGPTKALLKRFFSTDGWGPADDDALAAAVGPGEGTWRRDLDADVVLDYGWVDGRFGVRVSTDGRAAAEADRPRPAPTRWRARSTGRSCPRPRPTPGRSASRSGPSTGGPAGGTSRPRPRPTTPAAARLFAEFEEVANVLVGPDFVAVGLRRAPTGNGSSAPSSTWSPTSSPIPTPRPTPARPG